MKVAKFRAGERVKVELQGIKPDFPPIGYIDSIRRRIDYWVYHIKFDKGLFKHPLYTQVYEIGAREGSLTLIPSSKQKKT